MRVNNRYVSFYYENDNDMGAIEIDPEKTALLVVDMQHVFITRPALEIQHRKNWQKQKDGNHSSPRLILLSFLTIRDYCRHFVSGI